MPASEFSFNTTFKPVFQVYGTKRKANEIDHEPTEVWMQENSALANGAKRRCASINQEHPDNIAIQHNFLIQHNVTQESQMEEQPMAQESVPLQKPFNRHLQEVNAVHCERIPSPWPSESLENAVQYQHSQQPAPPSNLVQSSQSHNGQHIMDLNEETFNTYAGEVVGMDSELSHQCNSGSKTAQYLSGMENTNMSNNVRCYCRPTWDGYLDDKPWVSDYY